MAMTEYLERMNFNPRPREGSDSISGYIKDWKR